MMHSSYVLQVCDNMLHDHDYLSTPRMGRVVDFVDHMADECPEMNDFLCDFRTAQQCHEKLSVMQSKGQVLALSAMKDDNNTFHITLACRTMRFFSHCTITWPQLQRTCSMYQTLAKCTMRNDFDANQGDLVASVWRKSFSAH